MLDIREIASFLNGDGSKASSITRAVLGAGAFFGLYTLSLQVPEGYEFLEKCARSASYVSASYSGYQGLRGYLADE